MARGERSIHVTILGDDRQLSRTFGHAGKSARGFERDIGKASRGALAGSGAFRSMGRSLAFASGAFVGVASVTAALRASVDAAEEFGKASRGLGAQLKANGESAVGSAGQIAKANAQMARLGITAVDSETALSRLSRATGNIGKAIKLEGLAADLSAARHISLGQASVVVGKVVQGTTTAFNRLGLVLKKGTSVQDALSIATKRFAGQAQAASTPLSRLHAGVTNLEIAVGQALLPTVERIADSLNRWLSNSANVARVQRDIRSAVRTSTAALQAARTVLEPLVTGFRGLAAAVGGTEHAFEALFALGIAAKLSRLALAMTAFRAAAGGAAAGVGAAAGAGAGLATGALVDLAIGPGAIAAGGAALLVLQHKAQVAAEGVANARARSLAGTRAEAVLVPRLAEDFLKMKRAGVATADAVARLKHQLGGSLAAADLLAQALVKASHPADVLGRVVARGRVQGVFPATDPRRRATSLQGRFNLDELRLANVQRTANVKLQRALLVDEERITLKLRDQAKTLKERTKFAQQAAQLEDQLRSIDQQSASELKARRDKAEAARKKAAEAAKRAAELARSFSVPLRAQLAEAKASATKGTKDDLSAARAIKSLAQKALKSGRLGLQGQIDAWDAIASENQQIADILKKQAKATTTAFRKANLNKLLSGLGLTADQLRATRARLSQVGPGGTVPGTGQGAFGFALAGGAGTTVIPLQVNLDGHKIAQVTTKHQQRRERRNPRQKRGPHAA